MSAGGIRDDSWGFAEGDEIVPGRSAVRLLGGGHRYEAYVVWDDAMLTLVVAKVLRPQAVESPPARAALAREAKALDSLSHPALVRSFGHELDGERPHLVLEFLDGPRLSTLIRRHGVISEQLLPLALELCSVLHYMAERGWVHLDVKPRNVVMSAQPRLIDLSVAQQVSDVGELMTPTGTDAYMAPEQCHPDLFAEIGPASDVWGLGATLYEALTGSRPFPEGASDESAEPEERFPQLRVHPRPFSAAVSPALADLVLACLEARSENRPTAREFMEAVEPWVAALPRPRIGLFRPGGSVRRSVFETS